jgi:hypothetical protein
MVYGHPQQGYVLGGVNVAVKHSIAVATSKFFTLPVAYMLTHMAGLTCICRWHLHQLNTTQQTFITQKFPELAKTPFANLASEFLAFLLSRTTDSFEIFNSNSFALHPGNSYNLFADGVIDDGSRSPLPSRKPFQNTFGVLCAFGLKRTPYFLSFFPIGCKFYRIKFFAVTKGGYFHQAHVNAEIFFRISDFFCRYLYALREEKLPFTIKQVSFTFDAVKVSRVVADKRYFEPASNRPNGNDVIRVISQDAAIITDTSKRFENALDLFIQLVSISDLADASDNDLTAEISSTPNSVVRKAVKFKLLKSFFLPGNIRNQVTSLIGFLDGLKEQCGLLIIRQKFYFQGKFHLLKILTYLVNKKIKKLAGRIPPTHADRRWVGFLLPFYE